MNFVSNLGKFFILFLALGHVLTTTCMQKPLFSPITPKPIQLQQRRKTVHIFTRQLPQNIQRSLTKLSPKELAKLRAALNELQKRKQFSL